MRTAGHRIRVGRADVLIVKDGTEATGPASRYMHEGPREPASRSMTMLGGFSVIDHQGTRMLIDTGNGPAATARTHDPGPVLAAAGIAPETIQTILLTHGDPDHIGGLLRADGRLAYPNARIVLHEDLWTAWREPAVAGSYFPSQAGFIARLVEILSSDCQRITEEAAVAPGVRAIPSPGHRAGHTAYLLESSGERMLHIGDAAFDPVFLEYEDVLCASDTDPKEARISRQMLIERAVAGEARVIGSHFLARNVGRLHRGERKNNWLSEDPDLQGDTRRIP